MHQSTQQSLSAVRPGLEGVVAFETEIAEPDTNGSALRYRGIDIEELVGERPFEQVWGLLVDSSFLPGLPHEDSVFLESRSGRPMTDLQAASSGLSASLDLDPLIDISEEQARDDLGRLSAAMISIVAQIARGDEAPVPEAVVSQGKTAAERFLLRWRGGLVPEHASAIDSYWVSAAEHGMNASTFTARVVASTGADCGTALSAAVGALSGPLHGGAPARVLRMLDEVAASGDAAGYVKQALARGERLMGFGHRVYRAEDPRARACCGALHGSSARRAWRLQRSSSAPRSRSSRHAIPTG